MIFNIIFLVFSSPVPVEIESKDLMQAIILYYVL